MPIVLEPGPAVVRVNVQDDQTRYSAADYGDVAVWVIVLPGRQLRLSRKSVLKLLPRTQEQLFGLPLAGDGAPQPLPL